jgi:hypothetical protein
MKKFIVAAISMLVSVSSYSVGDAPEFLKGGTITVTLKDGTQYKFSSDEYAVVRRGENSAPSLPLTEQKQQELPSRPAAQEAHKNILSVGLVRSNRGFSVSNGANEVNVESQKSIGGSLQYQRRVTDEVYVGGSIDTNQGVGVNVGVGF